MHTAKHALAIATAIVVVLGLMCSKLCEISCAFSSNCSLSPTSVATVSSVRLSQAGAPSHEHHIDSEQQEKAEPVHKHSGHHHSEQIQTSAESDNGKYTHEQAFRVQDKQVSQKRTDCHTSTESSSANEHRDSHGSSQCPAHIDQAAILASARSTVIGPHLLVQQITDCVPQTIDDSFVKLLGELVANIPDRSPPKPVVVSALRI
jgi:hypothetical protein